MKPTLSIVAGIKLITPRVIVAAFVAIALMALVGCQSSQSDSATGDDATQTSLSPDGDLGELKDTERLVFTDSYAGRLVVYFDETIGIRLSPDTGAFYSKTTAKASTVEAIQGALNDFTGFTIKRSVSMSEVQVDLRRMKLEKLSGEKATDWNSIYKIEIDDPNEAVRVMRALEGIDGVELVYPARKMGLSNLTTTPDLITHQGYLYDSSQGGLNAVAAWNMGVYGQGVTLVDAESGWHADHLDLPTSNDPNPELGGGGCLAYMLPDPDCDAHVPHGTGVVGIMSALDNSHGVTGFAPQATMKLASARGVGLEDVIVGLTDGILNNGEIPPGSIIAFPVSLSGRLQPDATCLEDIANHYGCMPIDADPVVFDAVSDAKLAGITVVEGSANGQVDLDDPNAYYSYQSKFLADDSGAIIVGASEGPNYQRVFWSNCGSRVNSYAWGQNIATTGYPRNGIYDWFGTTTPLPPNTSNDAYFVDMFGGTSGATAMVAGAAALMQSYAKQLMSDTRYLMPLKIRDILSTTGTQQSGGGCNIGTQPDIDTAFTQIASTISAWEAAYPSLASNQPITQQDLLDLRADGLGIVCLDGDPANSDPSCPDESMWVPGSGIAKHLDFDADDRADLVSWSRGKFKIDFSSVGGDSDGFGAWDTIITYPEVASETVWPYVEDMNSDTREDLVLYDKENGTWYIAYTTSALIAGGGFNGWDHVITTPIADQLEMDPDQTFYCRPHPGDYDGNGWIDLAVACSDGEWYIADRDTNDDGMIDYDWPANGNIAYDNPVTYLTQQQLAEAPGWAYLTAVQYYAPFANAISDMVIKVPDGLAEEGRIIVKPGPNFTGDTMTGTPFIYGGNENVMFIGDFTNVNVNNVSSVGVKGSDGMWQVADPDFYVTLNDVYPNTIYGGLSCHPIAADFDGDGLDDRTVMCPYEWRIAYSGSNYASLKQGGYRTVNLSYAGAYSLPGRSYSGGISYDLAQKLLESLQRMDPANPPKIPVDMVMVGTCEIVGGDGCQ